MADVNPRRGCIEIVRFRLRAGVDHDAWAAENAKIEMTYSPLQSGFVRREAGIAADGSVVVILRWASRDDAIAAQAAWLVDDAPRAFRALADPTTLSVETLDIVKSHS